MERFIDLVNRCHGFEFSQAYRDFEDHFIGGKGNTYWYMIAKNGKVKEIRITTYDGGAWKDECVKGSGAKKTSKAAPSGSTMKRIVEAAYKCQEESWVKDRKGRLVEDGHPHLHYVKGFGDKACDISEEYGVTIGFSDLQDVPAGFHLRDLSIGEDVEMPV